MKRTSFDRAQKMIKKIKKKRLNIITQPKRSRGCRRLKSLNVIKEMVSVQPATIALWIHLGDLLSTKVALVFLLMRLNGT